MKEHDGENSRESGGGGGGAGQTSFSRLDAVEQE